MNMLELDCLPIDLGIERAVIQSQFNRFADNSRIIQADDYWEVSAPSHDNNGRLLSFFAKDYVSAFLNYPKCSRTVLTYSHKETGELITARLFKLLPKKSLGLANKSMYTPVFTALTIQPDNCTVVKYSDGRLYIKKHKLSGFPGNRVSSMVDTLVSLVDCGILTYNARTGSTPAHLRDAMQHILTRKESKFTHHCYEWQGTFNADLSAIVAPALERSAVYTFDGTCYQWPEKYEAGNTKGKRIQCRIKIYNISAIQEDRKNKPYQYIVSDIFKFEITFTHEFFIRHDDAKISAFKSQGDIFDLLLKHIVTQFKKFVLKPLTPLELNSFYRATGAANEAEFMKKLTNPDSLQVNIAAEFNAIKDRLNSHDKMFSDFKAEVKADIADFKAKQEAEILKLRAELGLHEANQDKRKLRPELRIVK
jgi:hypothetical protein